MPVTICVDLSSYDKSIVDDASDLTLGYWDSGEWHEADDVAVIGDTICGTTTHLSDWAVLGSTGEGTQNAQESTPTSNVTPTPTTATGMGTTPPSASQKSWIGGAIGGGIGLISVILITIYFNKRNSRKSKSETDLRMRRMKAQYKHWKSQGYDVSGLEEKLIEAGIDITKW